MTPPSRTEAVDAFIDAAQWFKDLVTPLSAEQLEGPGLGEWDLRELVAHAARALSTVGDYLRPEPPGGVQVNDEDPIGGAAGYSLVLRDNPQLQQDVAERGRTEAVRLGDKLVPHVAGEVERISRLASEAPASALFVGRFGTIGFATYLCTRTLELVVHGLDIRTVTGAPAEPPPTSTGIALAVLTELARQRGEGVQVIAALAGRRSLPPGFCVLT